MKNIIGLSKASALLSILILVLCHTSYALENLQEIYISAVPSTSPIAKKNIQTIQELEQKFLKAGISKNEINKLNLAFDNRDQAWMMANKLLRGIVNGTITSENISPYMAPEYQKIIKKEPRMMTFLIKQINELVLSKIKSLGDKAVLTDQIIQGKESDDYMRIQKKIGDDEINIVIFHQARVLMVLTADYPYKNWFMAAI